MDYNWQEIFKEKSNKELYDIYCGNSFLPISVLEFAKKELENRNFDFKDTKNMIMELKVEALAEEASRINLFLQKRPHVSLKSGLITMLILLFLFILFSQYYDIPIIFPILISGFASLGFLIDSLITNYIRKKKFIRLEKIEKEIRSLISQQNQNNNKEDTLSMFDFDKIVQTKVLSDLKQDRNLAIVVVLILITILLIKFIIS